jgi:hypothetical protein
MAEPAALDGMSANERQVLKEAVCDAVLERTRKIVSGEGDFGEIILGDRPSRVLSSGFILPRLDVGGDDASNDIRIAAHGMDLRLTDAEGRINIVPRFDVYVRALPTSDELFARSGRLLPKADFNAAAWTLVKAEIRNRSQAEIPASTQRAERTRQRSQISREVFEAHGVVVPNNVEVPAGDDRHLDTSQDLPPADTHGRLKIPNHLSRRYDIPQKWIRLPVDAPPLILPLPCDPHRWSELSDVHSRLLVQAAQQSYRDWIRSPTGNELAWRNVHPPSDAFWSAGNWDAFLSAVRQRAPSEADLIPAFEIKILTQALPIPTAPGDHSVRIAIENIRETDEALETGLFGVSVSVDLPDRALRPMTLERVRRSYHLAGFMTMPGIGVNGGIQEIGSVAGRRTLRSSWMPRYELPRIRAVEIAGLETSYEALGDRTSSLNHLRLLPGELRTWIEKVRSSTALSAPGEEGSEHDEAIQRVRFDADIDSWLLEAARIERGVELLLASQIAWQTNPNGTAAIPYKSWLFLNQTFSLANPQIPGQARAGWRLFQLAFVLCHVPTLASRIADYSGYFDAAFDEDAVSLLYMSTGGGKTEAFFGVLTYALFIDRLRGKKRGVTAMMHYPLRLLTVQQAQRLARLLAKAEVVRRREKVGGSAFEIGFWVGGNNTPNATERKPGQVLPALTCIPTWSDARGRDEAALCSGSDAIDREYRAAKEAWDKLPTCPFCRSKLGTALRLLPERHNRLAIVCLSRECVWNSWHNGPAPEPLPFLIVDTDIYRRAPAILLGTIDKLALLGQNTATIDRIAGMFGLARVLEGGPDGLLLMPSGEAAQDCCDNENYAKISPAHQEGTEVFVDPFPALIVQDEMHLLEESLGTFGGIFETGLFTWLERLSRLLGSRAARIPGAPDKPRLPHVIGATATAADVAKHTRALYQKSVIQFPHPGPTLHEGFYTRIAGFTDGDEFLKPRTVASGSPKAIEAAAPWGRVYASLMTNGRLHTVTTLSILAAHSATITRWQRDLSSGDTSRCHRASSEILDSIADRPWSDGRRRLIEAAAADGRFDRLAALVDLHRIELTYVTNKKGGDQILSALEAEVREAHGAMGQGYELRAYETALISGGVDIAGIQAVIAAAERAFDPMSDDIAGSLRVIVATSAISHGVDVESFNSMAFAGMPSDIAEYIQASSRVGRTHVGFSLLIPTPQTRRDRFVVEVHDSFHRLLERMISPPAVERWADRAIIRTVPSLVQMWIAGVRHQERFVAASAGQKASVKVPTSVEGAIALLRGGADFNACVEFVVEAIGVGASAGGAINPNYYSDLVRAAADRIRTTLASGEFTGRLQDFWENPLTNLSRPMTSLRDVDAAGIIVASSRSQTNQSLDWDDIASAMAVIRNRGASRDRRSANSELDSEA